jgi:hypothetical protein
MSTPNFRTPTGSRTGTKSTPGPEAVETIGRFVPNPQMNDPFFKSNDLHARQRAGTARSKRVPC